jgi:hypothetical protein
VWPTTIRPGASSRRLSILPLLLLILLTTSNPRVMGHQTKSRALQPAGWATFAAAAAALEIAWLA